MVEYDHKNDKITVLGQVISVSHAKQLSQQLDAALDTREAYMDMAELQEIEGLNDKAIRVLGGIDTPEDYPVRVGLAFEDRAGLADEYIIDWEDGGESWGDVIINEQDVVAFFEESTGLRGFHIEEYAVEYKE